MNTCTVDCIVLLASSQPPTARRPPLRVAAADLVNGVSGRVFQGDVVSLSLVGDVALSTQKEDFVARLLA